MRKNSASLDALPELATRWCSDLGLSVEARFEPSGDDELFPNRLVLDGPDAQWLAANKGAGLDALQFLLHEAQGQREESKLAYLDAQGARLFRMKEVKAMAGFAIQQARSLGSYRFSSLTPRERRWVHMVVAREEGLSTESEGTGNIKALKVFRA
ncbi:R3H domain-containing nucleic acid-binding protein [Holophaga foetida]|uniref:R3H domain-containing nucleic acid-binding protein n=1 Tax=Holophaga foetida TaxID=35839 RepID=UPI0002474D51|nr:R3H domain-containing nucleic acid-binding protein [Holophaga foetida]